MKSYIIDIYGNLGTPFDDDVIAPKGLFKERRGDVMLYWNDFYTSDQIEAYWSEIERREEVSRERIREIMGD